MKLPILIVIDGPMGTGKSTVASMLQKKLDRKTALISLDKLKRIVSDYKLDSKEHLELAAKAGAAMANLYLKENINVIVEKAFTKKEFLESFIKRIKTKSRKLIYQIEAPIEITFPRIKEREKLKEKGIPRNKLKEKVMRNYSHYKEGKYDKAKVFDSSKLTPRKIVNQVIKNIK